MTSYDDETKAADPARRSATFLRLLIAVLLISAALTGIFLLVVFWLPNSQPPSAETETVPEAQSDSDVPQPASPRADATPTPSNRETTRPGAGAASQDPADKNAMLPEDLRFGTLPDEPEARMAALRDEAVRVARQVASDLPRRPEAAGLEAYIYDRFDEGDRAIDSWRKALEIKPDFAEAYAGLGKIAMDQGQYEQAETNFRKALEIREKMPEVRESLARSLMNQGRIEDAIDYLKTDVQLFPDAVSSHFFLGQAYVQLGQLEPAVESFRKAIQLDPACTYAYYGLANSYRKLGNRKQATQSLENFRRLKQQDLAAEKAFIRGFDDEEKVREAAAFAHNGAANLYARNQQLSKAIVHWVRATEVDPGDVRSRLQLVQLFQNNNDLPRAARYLRELKKIDPTNPMHALSLGAVLLRMNQLDAAEDNFREALIIAPDKPTVYANLANFLMSRGQNLAEARELAQKAVDLEGSARNYALLGAAEANLKNFAKAVSWFDRARQKEPQNQEYAAMYQRAQQMVKMQEQNVND